MCAYVWAVALVRLVAGGVARAAGVLHAAVAV